MNLETYVIDYLYKNNTIEFNCENELLGVLPEPRPAFKMIPDYFKKIPSQIGPNVDDISVKKCVPFLDAMSSGYIIPLWADMHVIADNNNIKISFPKNFPQESSLETHPISQINGHPLQNRPYGDIPLKFINPWVIKTPPGVSCLFTSPLNHLNPQIKILDGVVDTDTYYNNVNLPFVWTGGDGDFFFPVETPLVQIIPFKRNKFKHKIGSINELERKRTSNKLGTKLTNAYKTFFWHKRK